MAWIHKHTVYADEDGVAEFTYEGYTGYLLGMTKKEDSGEGGSIRDYKDKCLLKRDCSAVVDKCKLRYSKMKLTTFI